VHKEDEENAQMQEEVKEVSNAIWNLNSFIFALSTWFVIK